MFICAVGNRGTHRTDKFRTAVGIDGMVTGMVGDHDFFELHAFGKPCCHGEHDAVAERHHGGTHVVIGIVALWNLVGSGEKRALEVTAHEFKINLDPADAEPLAVPARTFGFAAIVV